MFITKCDACGKTVKNRDQKIRVDSAIIKNYSIDFCEKCATPVIATLKKLDLLKN